MTLKIPPHTMSRCARIFSVSRVTFSNTPYTVVPSAAPSLYVVRACGIGRRTAPLARYLCVFQLYFSLFLSLSLSLLYSPLILADSESIYPL